MTQSPVQRNNEHLFGHKIGHRLNKTNGIAEKYYFRIRYENKIEPDSNSVVIYISDRHELQPKTIRRLQIWRQEKSKL